MRLIAFLGTSKYDEVEYGIGGLPILRTRFVTEALAVHLKPERIVLLLTEEVARHANGPALVSALEARGLAVETARVPHGEDEAELWEIFRVIETAAGGEDVALDITHGYRCLPLVGLLAAGYFHAIATTQLRGLYYGVFNKEADHAPILDLSPMLDLAGWAAAVRSWREYRDPGALRGLVRAASGRARRNAAGSPVVLNGLAEKLADFTDQMRLGRHDVRGAAGRLESRIQQAELEVGAYAPPLRPLLQEMAAPLGQLRQSGVAGDLALIRLQRRAGSLLIAVLLARETMVSIWQEKQRLPTREVSECDLNQRAHERQREQPGALWKQLADLRNDLAHCGWRRDPRGAEQARGQFDRHLAELELWATSLSTAATGGD